MRKIIATFLAVLLALTLALTASAEHMTDLVLSIVDVDTPVAGVKFEIYRVGEMDQEGAVKLTGAFSDYPVQIDAVGEDTSAEANALFGFAKLDALNPYASITTDEAGAAEVKGLGEGVYLVGGWPVEVGAVVYHTEPQLVVLPHRDAATGEIVTNPVFQVKFAKETSGTIVRKVLKVWDDNLGHARPVEVTIHLLKDGTIHDTVILDAQTQWRHTWEGLDATALWQMVEEVPEHYAVKVEREGTTILVKNSAPDMPPPEIPSDPTEPTEPGGDIPQTGMLWWPVVLLGGLGIGLVAGGVILRRGSKHEA